MNAQEFQKKLKDAGFAFILPLNRATMIFGIEAKSELADHEVEMQETVAQLKELLIVRIENIKISALNWANQEIERVKGIDI